MVTFLSSLEGTDVGLVRPNTEDELLLGLATVVVGTRRAAPVADSLGERVEAAE
jgi:hypothetical protein